MKHLQAHPRLTIAVLILLLAVGVARLGFPSQLSGAGKIDLGAKQAPEFSLLDQTGKSVRLNDLRGRAVALTFVYTNCKEMCPIAISKFEEVYDKLDRSQRGKAALVAISVDPERDTVERVSQYVEGRRIQDKVLYLTGNRPSLEAVWASYYLGVIKGPAGEGHGGSADDYVVTHKMLTYLIDPEGRERSLFVGDDFTASQLLREVRSLL